MHGPRIGCGRLDRARLLPALLAALFGAVAAPMAAAPARAQEPATAAAYIPCVFFIRTSTIEGKVTEADGGAPIEGVRIDLYEVHDTFALDYTYTDAQGNYSIDSVPAGTFVVHANRDINPSDPPPSYIGQIFDGQASPATYTPVIVGEGEAVQDVDFALERGAVYTGKVTKAGNAPVANAYIAVYDASGGFPYVAGAKTDATGNYTTRPGLAPGAYYLRVWFPPGDPQGLADEWWKDAATLQDAQTHVITSVMTVTLNMTVGPLPPKPDPAVVQGTVRASDTNAPLPNVKVRAAMVDNASVFTETSTSAAGQYTLPLAPGAWTLEFRPSAATDYVREYHDNTFDSAASTPLTLTEGLDVEINALLSKGVRIVGTVMAEPPISSTVSGLDVYILDDEASPQAVLGQRKIWSITRTGNDGTYRSEPLPPDKYIVKFAPSPYIPNTCPFGFEYSGDVTNITDADVITLALPGPSVTVDAELNVSGGLSGRITRPLEPSSAAGHADEGVSGVLVVAFLNGGGEPLYTQTLATGHYRFLTMPPGNYTLTFFKFGYAPLYYDQKTRVEDATPVPVVAEVVEDGIDAVLTSPGAPVYLPTVISE